MTTRAIIAWLQYTFANVVIVVVVACLTLEGLPPVIDWVWFGTQSLLAGKKNGNEEVSDEQQPLGPTYFLHSYTSSLTSRLGIWTGEWTMFAPNPDSSNHRIRADIEYYDGRRAQWRSPDWPELSCWRRFWTSRELEYIDAIAYNGDMMPEHWSAFADYLAREHRLNPAPGGAPQKVRLIVEEAQIENPVEFGWLPMSQRLPRTTEEVRFIRKYSPPKEGRDKGANHLPGMSAKP